MANQQKPRKLLHYIAYADLWINPTGRHPVYTKAYYVDRDKSSIYAHSIIESLKLHYPKNSKIKIHELGIGWGTVLDVIGEEYPNAILSGNDIWKDAVAYIQEEHPHIAVEDKNTIKFIKDCVEKNTKFDVVISNAHLILLPDKKLKVLSNLSHICDLAILQESIVNLEYVFSDSMTTKNIQAFPGMCISIVDIDIHSKPFLIVNLRKCCLFYTSYY